MTMLELPHINMLTKCDLLTDDGRKTIEWCLEIAPGAVAEVIQREVRLSG
jgi:hypothetical protein